MEKKKDLPAKEQAEYMFGAYRMILLKDESCSSNLVNSVAKKNALLCLHYVLFSFPLTKNSPIEDADSYEYWREVKREIQKM